MTRYAENTSVSVEKSRSEIERILRRYGAEKFVGGWDQARAYIGFVFKGRAYKVTLTLPSRGQFIRTPKTHQARSGPEIECVWKQACRQHWRALALIIKAKLEAVEIGIVSLEDEFLSYAVLPSGQTVSQWLQPQIQRTIETGQMPVALLPGE